MEAQLFSPELFGRDSQMADLRQWLSMGNHGREGVVLVAGEAGIGKSRLLSEALQAPKALQFTQIRANCLQGDEAEPYSLARSLYTAAGGSPAGIAVDPAPEAERQVRQVQQELSAQFVKARCDQPLLVTIEDVHWSDSPSLQVLLALILQPGPILYLLSYRPEPMTPGLANFLAEVSRLRLGQTMTLQPLSKTDTGRMVRSILGLQDILPAALLAEVMKVTDGLPFLIEELLHTLIERGDLEAHDNGWHYRRGTALAVPGSLRHALEGRLLLQSPQTIAVAEQAAVAGQVINVTQLARLAGLGESELFTALHALIEAYILIKQQDGTIAFRHALTRESIRTRLLQAERQMLHRRVALMLEEGDAAASTLAYHWSEAGEIGRAADHALRAAEQGALLHAHREAIIQYEIALDGGAETKEEIFTALGDQYEAQGEFEQAIACYRKAQAIYREANSMTDVAILDLRTGISYSGQRLRYEAIESLEAAFANLPDDHPER